MAKFQRERIVALASAIAALGFITATRAQQSSGAAGPSLVDGAVLKNAGAPADRFPGAWRTYGRSQSETRFSPLKQIDTSNVKRLGLAWTYVIGAGGGNQEGTPLVWNNTLYGITAWSVVFALDGTSTNVAAGVIDFVEADFGSPKVKAQIAAGLAAPPGVLPMFSDPDKLRLQLVNTTHGLFDLDHARRANYYTARGTDPYRAPSHNAFGG